MNKLNYFKLVAFVAIILFAISSCSDDDKEVDITKENIIGTWQFVYDEGYEKDGNERIPYGNNIESEGWYITFHTDGSFREVDDDDDEVDSGTWNLSGKNLTINYLRGSSPVYNIVKLQENTLIMDRETNSYYEKYTLKRR